MTALDLTPATLATLTMPQVLKRRADAHPGQLALREKVRGIWHEKTWRDYFANARRGAIGLYALGFRPGDRVAVASENTPEWFYADMAAQMLGGACLGIYPTNPWPELQYIVRHSKTKFVVCGDQEQTDKVIEAQRLEGGLPDITNIICVDMKGMRHYRQNNLMSFDALLDLGDTNEAKYGAEVDRLLAAGQSADIAVVVYTSGTTGMPKGATLSHRNMLYSASKVVERLGLTASTYSVVCYLPLCHVAERSFSTLMHLLTGCVVSFAESVDTVVTNLREIAPLGFLGVPRIWEKMQQSVQYRIKDTRRFQRRVFEACIAHGMPIAERRLQNGGKLASLRDRIAFSLLWLLCYRSLQRFLGLNRVRNGFCGGATVSPSVLMFFWILGVPVYQIYGMTEAGGVTHLQQPGYTLPGCSGLILEGLEQRLADDDELLIRGESIFPGYLYDEAAKARALQDGWLHTGDIVRFESNGEVSVYDRKKDIIITSGGKNITPSLIENALKDSIYIREAILLGDGRKFLAALVQIDYDTVGQWAQEHNLPYTTYRNLAEHREVFDLIQAEVEKVNGRFARVENIRKFVILSKQLDHDDGELTATMKIRRKIIDEKFTAEIQHIYGSEA
jgi:long-chain acyl-CoA synthetase